MKLWQKVTLGLISGIICGVYFPDTAVLLKPIGEVFLRLIKMIIVPLVFFSLVSGITSMSDPKTLGRMGAKATFAFIATTIFAVLFGLAVAEIFKPGLGFKIDLSEIGDSSIQTQKMEFNLVKFLVEIIPSNAISAIVEGNILQVVFFAFFTAFTVNTMGSSGTQLKSLFHSLNKMVLKMIGMIISLSPYGAFSLTAWVIGSQGLGILYSLGNLVLAVIFAMIVQYIIFGVLILVFCKISPIPFYKKSIPYQLLAFSTSSSKATLATTMQICREDLGVSEASTSFVLPFGASINMDGLAINLGLSAVFFAQVFGIDLSFSDYFIIIITATLGSIGGAGIPGASLIMLPMVLSSVNIPIEGVAVLAGVDRILDMLRTTINITGDATVTLIVDHSEGLLDLKKYHSKPKNI